MISILLNIMTIQRVVMGDMCMYRICMIIVIAIVMEVNMRGIVII